MGVSVVSPLDSYVERREKERERNQERGGVCLCAFTDVKPESSVVLFSLLIFAFDMSEGG